MPQACCPYSLEQPYTEMVANGGNGCAHRLLNTVCMLPCLASCSCVPWMNTTATNPISDQRRGDEFSTKLGSWKWAYSYFKHASCRLMVCAKLLLSSNEQHTKCLFWWCMRAIIVASPSTHSASLSTSNYPVELCWRAKHGPMCPTWRAN